MKLFSSYPVRGRAPRFLLTSSNSYHSDRISPTIPAKTLKNIPETITLLRILFPRAASQTFQSLLWVFNAINANQLTQNKHKVVNSSFTSLFLSFNSLFKFVSHYLPLFISVLSLLFFPITIFSLFKFFCLYSLNGNDTCLFPLFAFFFFFQRRSSFIFLFAFLSHQNTKLVPTSLYGQTMITERHHRHLIVGSINIIQLPKKYKYDFSLYLQIESAVYFCKTPTLAEK